MTQAQAFYAKVKSGTRNATLLFAARCYGCMRTVYARPFEACRGKFQRY